MPAPKHLLATQVEPAAQKLEALQGTEPSLKLAEFVERLAPQMTAARKRGVPASVVCASVAEDAHCSPDMIQRYYRRAIASDSASRRKRR